MTNFQVKRDCFTFFRENDFTEKIKPPEVNKQMTGSKQNKKSPEDPVVVHLHSTFGYVSPFDTMYFVIPGIISWCILRPCHQTF